MKVLVALAAVLVATCVVVAEARSQRDDGRQRGGRHDKSRPGGRGAPQGGRPGHSHHDHGAGPALSAESAANITQLADSVGNETLKTELNKLVNAKPVDMPALTALLVEVAAGNVGGSQSDWDRAELILIDIASSIGPGSFGGGKPGGDSSESGSSEEGESSHGNKRPPMSPIMGLASLVPIRISMAKLRTYVASSEATQEQKDLYTNLRSAIDLYKLSINASMLLGQKPDVAVIVERDLGMLETLRKASDDLDKTGSTTLSEGIAKGRAVARARMAEELDAYTATLRELGLTSLADEIDALREQYKASGGPTTAIANSMVATQVKVATELKAKAQTTTDSAQLLKLQKLIERTDKATKMLTAIAPYADRINTALNGTS